MSWLSLECEECDQPPIDDEREREQRRVELEREGSNAKEYVSERVSHVRE